MPPTPPQFVGIAGRKMSGKSTLSDALCLDHNYVPIALADPLKQRCATLFDLDPELFFGSTEQKESPLPDSLILTPRYWASVWARWEQTGCWRDLLATAPPEALARIPAHSVWAFSLLASSPQVSPRKIMQVLGTEYARNLYLPVWTEGWQRMSARVLAGAAYDPRTGAGRGRYGPAPTGVVCHDVRFPNECAAVRTLGGIVLYLDADARIGGRTDAHASEPNVSDLEGHIDAVIPSVDRAETLRIAREALGL